MIHSLNQLKIKNSPIRLRSMLPTRLRIASVSRKQHFATAISSVFGRVFLAIRLAALRCGAFSNKQALSTIVSAWGHQVSLNRKRHGSTWAPDPLDYAYSKVGRPSLVRGYF